MLNSLVVDQELLAYFNNRKATLRRLARVAKRFAYKNAKVKLDKTKFDAQLKAALQLSLELTDFEASKVTDIEISWTADSSLKVDILIRVSKTLKTLADTNPGIRFYQ